MTNILTAGCNIMRMVMCGLGVQATPAEYELTIIQDEAVPLSPSVPSANEPSYFVWTIVMMLAMVVIAAAGAYIFRCAKYRKTYYAMMVSMGTTGKMKDPGWNLMKLKQLVDETESQLVGRMV